MGVVGRLDQYASILASEFDEYSMRENLVAASNFTSGWFTNNSATVTLNAATSPDGSVNATQIAASAIAGSGIFRTTSLTSGTVYTYSLFVKAVSGSNTFYIGNDITSETRILINTSTGVASSIIGSPTNITSTSYPNSWYRVSFTFTANFTGSHSFVMYNFSANANTWLVYGPQIERGSAVTDYTPTTGTAIISTIQNTNISQSGTYYSTSFDENASINTLPSSTLSLSANIFAPYDPVYDEFGGTLFGAGQGRYMRHISRDVIVYNEIDEISDFRDIVRSGMVLDLDAGMNSSFNNTETTWNDLTNSRSTSLAVGQQEYTTAGTYTFTVPNGCTSISAVVVGGGGGGAGCDGAQVRNETNNGGGGGGLAYGTIAVTPGETLTVVVGAGGPAGGDDSNGLVGGDSTIIRSGTTLLSGGGGAGGQYRSQGFTSAGGASGGTARIGGGSGGNSGAGSGVSGATGGGGAGGYSGNGGNGGAQSAAGSAGAGGGAGGGGGFGGQSDTLRAGGGGGVGIRGTGSNGSAGVINGGGGGGGSALTSVTEGTSGGNNTSGLGGTYGGGGGGKADAFTASGTATPTGGAGTGGAVRIVWGTGRSYPSTGLTNFTTVVGYDNALHSAQLINSPTYNSSNGGYLVFNGTNQYVTSSFTIASGQAVTYCGWLYSTETTATYRNFVDSVSAAPMIWWNNSGQIEFDAALYTTTAVYRNQWVYVALSKPSGNSSPSYYVNGVLVGSGSAYTTPAVTPTWFNRAAAQTWKGNASAVQAYNRALSAAEILQNYNALKHRFGL
jgi:hypothetical protein